MARPSSATLARMPSVRPQPLLAVRDVRASARFYAALLGATRTSELMASDHDDLYDRLLVDGALVLQLHAWDAEEHPNLVDPDGGRNGGVSPVGAAAVAAARRGPSPVSKSAAAPPARLVRGRRAGLRSHPPR